MRRKQSPVLPGAGAGTAHGELRNERWLVLVDRSQSQPTKVLLRDGLISVWVLSHTVCSAIEMPMYKHIRFCRISCQVLEFTMLTALNKFFVEITDLLGSYPSEGRASDN